MSHTASADQPARGPDGQLLDASKIDWYNDPDDPHPIQPISRVQEGEHREAFNHYLIVMTPFFWSGRADQRSRPVRSTAGTRLAEAIAAEKLDEFGSSCRRFILPRDAKAPAKRKRPTTDASRSDVIQVDSDPEDQTFAVSVSEGGNNDDSSDSDGEDEIANEEVCTDPN
jgi:hypothetical protein